MNVIFYLLAFVAGMATSLQVAVNSQGRLRLGIQHWPQATLVNFLGGTLVLIAICAVCRFPLPTFAEMSKAPWWVWTGGVLGILYVSASILLGPMLGNTLFLVLVVSGQLIGALLIDHYGILGSPVKAATPGRLLGVGIVLVGMIVVWTSTTTPASNDKPDPRLLAGRASDGQ